MNATMRRDHVYLVSRRDKKKILPSYAGCPFSEAGNSKYYTLNLRARGVQRGSFWRLNNERKGGLSSHCLRSDESLKHWRWEHLGDGRRRRRSSCWSGEKVTLIRFPFSKEENFFLFYLFPIQKTLNIILEKHTWRSRKDTTTTTTTVGYSPEIYPIVLWSSFYPLYFLASSFFDCFLCIFYFLTELYLFIYLFTSSWLLVKSRGTWKAGLRRDLTSLKGNDAATRRSRFLRLSTSAGTLA